MRKTMPSIKELLGGKDFRVKISSQIADAALFQKFLCLLFHEAFMFRYNNFKATGKTDNKATPK